MTHCDVFRKQRVDRFAPRSLDTIALKQHKPAERAISAKRHSAKRVQHQSMEYATGCMIVACVTHDDIGHGETPPQ